MGKLINRIPGSRLLISSLPGSALRTHVESLVKPRDVNKALPGKLDIKRHSPSILYLSHIWDTIQRNNPAYAISSFLPTDYQPAMMITRSPAF